MTTDNLTQSAGRSILWQIVGGGWQALVRIGASVFLARALQPIDFGIFGMAILVKEFVGSVGALGMGTGLVAKKEVTDDDLCTSFWSMAAMRLIMFAGMFAGAPLAAGWLEDPRIVDVVRAVSFIFLIMIIQESSYTLLVKELRFRAINTIGGIGIVLQSGIAVFLAINTDLGYWALVLAMLVFAVFSSLTTFVVAGWRPRFRFSRESFRYLFRYGINGLGFSIVNYLTQNLDYLLVGRVLGARALGLYEFAYRIPHMIQENVVKPVGSVVLPTLSKVQESNERLIAGYIKTVKFVALMAFPALAGLAVVADVAVPVLWGDQWVSIVTPLRILCLCAALRILPQPSGAVLYCKNRPDIPFKISLVGLVWTAAAVGGLGYVFGLNGVAWGMLLSVLPSFAAVIISFRLTDSSTLRLAEAVWPVVAMTAVCALAAFGAKVGVLGAGWPLIVVLSLSVVAGAVAYPLALLLLFPTIGAEILSTFEDVAGRPAPAMFQRLVRLARPRAI